MREALDDFINYASFPITTGAMKAVPLIPYLSSIEPKNISIFGWYVALSAISDLVEGSYRAWFRPHSEIPFSFAEKHICTLLAKAGGMTWNALSKKRYTRLTDFLGAGLDGLKGE